jgi:2-oxoglutarate dehydrogenase E2 component (dihydrolipoamide succinyltransferase)
MAEQTSVLQEVMVPELGESVLEATVSHWMKKEGEEVSSGEPLVELETEKVNLEVSAQRSGILTRILHQEGEDVRVGDVLGMIEETHGGEAQKREVQPVAPESEPSRMPQEKHEDEGRTVPATPVAERIGRAEGIDLNQVKGTGLGGRVTKADLESYRGKASPSAQVSPEPASEDQAISQDVAQPAQPRAKGFETGQAGQEPVSADHRPETRARMTRRRRTIARRLVEAQQTAAILTTFNEADMSAVMELRSRRNDMFLKRYNIKLGITSFFVKAVIGALKAFPQLNAEIEGDEIVYKRYYDIGVAVGATEGLVVPVLRDADRLSFAAIEGRIKEFAQKAEQDRFSLEDLRGGTFTITNGGVFGSLLSTPILNPPQVGILGLHKIEKRPIVINDELVIRPMMYLALSYDHRIVDGREAVQFLVRVKELVEDPETLLLEG